MKMEMRNMMEKLEEYWGFELLTNFLKQNDHRARDFQKTFDEMTNPISHKYKMVGVGLYKWGLYPYKESIKAGDKTFDTDYIATKLYSNLIDMGLFFQISGPEAKGNFYFKRDLAPHADMALETVARILTPEVYEPALKLNLSFTSRVQQYIPGGKHIGIEGEYNRHNCREIGNLILAIDNKIDEAYKEIEQAHFNKIMNKKKS